MENKTVMAAADLFVLLDREFRRRKRRDCEACFISLPFRVDARGDGSSDWDMVMPRRCDKGCEETLEELLAEFQGRYSLVAGGESP